MTGENAYEPSRGGLAEACVADEGGESGRENTLSENIGERQTLLGTLEVEPCIHCNRANVACGQGFPRTDERIACPPCLSQHPSSRAAQGGSACGEAGGGLHQGLRVRACAIFLVFSKSSGSTTHGPHHSLRAFLLVVKLRMD